MTKKLDSSLFDTEERSPRGLLTFDVDRICRAFANGEIELEEGKFLTPYNVGTILVQECNGERKRPSAGAIAAIFLRMEKDDYARFRQNPHAFIGLTEAGRAVRCYSDLKVQSEGISLPDSPS